MAASNNILPLQSNYPTLDMPLIYHDIRNFTEREHIMITTTPIQFVRVKQEVSDAIIDIFSEPEGESPSQPSL